MVVRNERKYIWCLTAGWFGRNLTLLIVEALEHHYAVPVSEEVFLKAVIGAAIVFGAVGFVLGLIFDKRLKFIEECYRADFDRFSLLKLFLKEAGIILLLVIAGVAMEVAALNITEVHIWPFF